MMEFLGFPKMPRLARDVVVTEKIDGTNAQVFIFELEGFPESRPLFQKDGLALCVGSRTRWITPEQDNAGFARWCLANAEELLLLGPGRHFGEWWGQGIQRAYGLKEKRFSLFNTARWPDDARPSCCHVVPVLYSGIFDTAAIDDCVEFLRANGSQAAPGFSRPEGIVAFHTAGNFGLKKTLDKDGMPKSLAGV